MITLLENAVSNSLTQKIRERCGEFLDAAPHNSFNRTYNRIGKTVKISEIAELSDLDNEIANFIQNFSAEFVQPVFRPAYGVADTGYEFHRYDIGEQCLVHSDQEIPFGKLGEQASLIRFATVIIHLNTVRDGGLTVFPDQNKSFNTVAGQILIFPPIGMYPHYVTPSEEIRDILMTWLVYDTVRAVRT